MKIVRSQMRLLVAAKEHRERRKLSLRTIVQETEVPISTVQALMNDSARRVELNDIGKLCSWLPCEVGELLRLEDVPETA
jgi:DNA-binding Xre family transcriptional regulator